MTAWTARDRRVTIPSPAKGPSDSLGEPQARQHLRRTWMESPDGVVHVSFISLTEAVLIQSSRYTDLDIAGVPVSIASRGGNDEWPQRRRPSARRGAPPPHLVLGPA